MLDGMAFPEASRFANDKENDMAFMTCRCCGKPITGILDMDGSPIHTRCIPKHWGKHAHGKNASRCHEFRPRPCMDCGITLHVGRGWNQCSATGDMHTRR